MKDTSNRTLDNLTLLAKLVCGLLVANIFMIWYAVYEFRTYRQATKLLRSGVDFVEKENLFRFTELDNVIRYQKGRENILIQNKGTVNIKGVK